MSDSLLPVSQPCSRALEAILADPLEPGTEAEVHMQTCRACSEARVTYLAQEDAPLVLAPAGYFERLPGRVLGKLPASRLPIRTRRFYWGAAAALLLSVGATAFWVGRANRTPLVEAHLPRPTIEVQEGLPDTPFQDQEDALTQLTALSQQEADAVMQTLSLRQAQSPTAK